MLSNNFAIVVCVDGSASAQHIRDALDKIHLRHPALALTGAAEVFPLTVHPECADGAWVELVESELAKPFPEGPGPKARFHLLERTGGFNLVGCFDHGRLEGMSGIFVLRDILQLVGDPAASFSAIPAQPAIENFIPHEILSATSFRLKLGLVMAAIRGYLWLGKVRARFLPRPTRNPAQIATTGTNPPLDNQFVVLPTLLEVAPTSALAARCKAEQVSVHAAMCVAWLRAFLTENKPGMPQAGMISSPVDLRQRFASVVPETSGLYMTLVETSIKFSAEQNFWDAAREFKKKFEENLRPHRLFFLPVMLKKVMESFSADDLKTLTLATFGRSVKHDFSISNLGRVAIPQRMGSLRVQAFYGLVNAAPSERTVVVGTQGGKMSICLLFRKSMMEPDVGRRLLDRAMLVLADATQAH